MTRQVLLILQEWADGQRLCGDLLKEIEDYQQQISTVRGLTGINYDGMPHGTSVGNPTEQKAISAISLEESYTKHVAFLGERLQVILSHQRLVTEALGRLPAKVTEVAELRYKRGYPWWRVADTAHISEQYAKDLHTSLIKEVQAKLKTK